MWEVVELRNKHSEWKRLGIFESLDELRNSQQSGVSDDSETFCFWNARFPTDPSESQRLYERIVEMNGGKNIRLTVGASISHLDSETPSGACSGKCFCVIAHGSRRCEVCYQNEAGSYCIDCGSSC